MSYSSDVDQALEMVTDNYQGLWDSMEDFAADLFEQTGDLEKVPEFIRYHIDWEGVARDLELSGDYCEVNDKDQSWKVHIFRTA
jgi:antirestriction protein